MDAIASEIKRLATTAAVSAQQAKAKLLMDHGLTGSKTVVKAIGELNTSTAALIQLLQLLNQEFTT